MTVSAIQRVRGSRFRWLFAGPFAMMGTAVLVVLITSWGDFGPLRRLQGACAVAMFGALAWQWSSDKRENIAGVVLGFAGAGYVCLLVARHVV